MSDSPIVLARRDGVQLVIRCPYCHKEHRHGAVGPKLGDGDGHCVSHCADTANPGYILMEEVPR
ncbi:hypothetical protein ACFT43_06455 [Streptomyces albidoflavus]